MYDSDRLRAIKTFPSLVKYLRDELDWPIEQNDFEDLDDFTFDYIPEEIGLDAKTAAKIEEIKQLRPLITNQPWGIFFIKFQPKRLPVVVLRRILGSLVTRKRASARKAERASWDLHDLLFISNYGEGDSRQITFAHFSEDKSFGDLPTLRVLDWDDADTALHIDHVHREMNEKLRWPDNTSDVVAWRSRWSSVFTLRHREVITTSKHLSERLAKLAADIRKRVNAILRMETEQGPLRRLQADFKKALIHDLSDDDFADMYAQTITYGLLTARVSRPAGLVAENVKDMVPITNPFLRDLLSTFLTVGGRKGKIDFDEVGINDVVETLRNADMEAVLRDFGDRKPEEDPVIFFYEDFLKAYDAQKKVKRGVFYTPKPVVSYIARSVHEILQRDFGLMDGLADTTTWEEMQSKHKGLSIPRGLEKNTPFVQILDPATGTGTFLVEVIDVIHRTLVEKWKRQGLSPNQLHSSWNTYVQKHLLPRLYGFELMMAPYAIAHMKFSLKLAETGYRFDNDARARIYLTNTLEEPEYAQQLDWLAPLMAREAQAANEVKKSAPITVVIGNPPYSYASSNTGRWISGLVRDYYQVDGKPLKERNPKGLQDDYVKFIRYGQYRVEQSGVGILAYITNHGYLDNPTFRGMRQSLITSFGNIFLVDLHGNTKKKVNDFSGGKDENVFDITQGVAVGCFVKLPKRVAPVSEIFYGNILGERKEKYNLVARTTIKALCTNALQPRFPHYLFCQGYAYMEAEYENGESLSSIFHLNLVGLYTARDDFIIHYSSKSVRETITDFISLSAETARIKYSLGNDTSEWKIQSAQKDIGNFDSDMVNEISYRPFDTRYTYYTGTSNGLMCRPRPEVMLHLLRRNNIALCFMRRSREQVTSAFFVAKNLVDKTILSSADNANISPLYLYRDAIKHSTLCFEQSSNNTRIPNISLTSIKKLESKLGIPFIREQRFDQMKSSSVGAEDFFYYIYAIVYSHKYRQRYADYIKSDFARIPLTSSIELFHGLGKLGYELTTLHLMESSFLDKFVTTFHDQGDLQVSKIAEKGRTLAQVQNGKGRIYINNSSYFDCIPLNVWEFCIGGYQVCYKWLKDRKGRTLSKEDIEHYQRIVVALSETIRLMQEIDEVIDQHGGWPEAFS